MSERRPEATSGDKSMLDDWCRRFVVVQGFGAKQAVENNVELSEVPLLVKRSLQSRHVEDLRADKDLLDTLGPSSGTY